MLKKLKKSYALSWPKPEQSHSINEWLDKGFNATLRDTDYLGSDKRYILLYKGKRIATRSGKDIWRAVAHAKSALKAHMDYLINKYNAIIYFNTSRKILEEEIREFIKENFQIVEI